MTYPDSPLNSLQAGRWFKLICGASYQHLPAVRNLALAYTLAGADCIDVAPDPAVVASAQAGLRAAAVLQPDRPQPWLMVSFNDGEDPHFRKASFDSHACPPECPQPCARACPAEAIVFGPQFSGVVDPRCYGCGRCLPLCPPQIITTRPLGSSVADLAPLVLGAGVDALELHTQVGHQESFRRLWAQVQPWVGRLQLLAISCGDGEGLLDYLHFLLELITPLPCPLVWQTDGRPMSGDLGVGATRAALRLGQKVLAAGLPGYVQLAGGTNDQTALRLAALGLLKGTSQRGPWVAGIGYGSYARALVNPLLDGLGSEPLEVRPQTMTRVVDLARSLVQGIKNPEALTGAMTG